MQFSDAASAVAWADTVANSPDVRGTLAKLLHTPGNGDSDSKNEALTIMSLLHQCRRPESDLYHVVYGDHCIHKFIDITKFVVKDVDWVVRDVAYSSPPGTERLAMALIVSARQNWHTGKPLSRSMVARITGVTPAELNTGYQDVESSTRELIDRWLNSTDRNLSIQLERIGVI